jgi:hypothetical protein
MRRTLPKVLPIAMSAVLLIACVEPPQPKPNVDNVGPRPVMVGGFAHADSCTSTGTINGLRTGGDGTVPVRAAPSTAARRLDRLKPGRPLWLCRTDDSERWVGVVYPENEDGMSDCGLSENAHDKPVPYAGPCKSGWVARRFIELSAG